ncbi:TIR domain-containing protein [Aquipseudomonas alcaligenes]|uniref:TIR domain-containing protein n=1 Tax=Aquipseudomonas alcaligenes TaxID=43263 RepID=UPI0029302C6D|nr:TIR domain-containing protein [Pseudomonas alcaligenes]
MKSWIDDQLKWRTCTIVQIGTETANRSWFRYKIEQSWNSGKGLLGIRVHKLLNHNQQPSVAGANPFDASTLNDGKSYPPSSVCTIHREPRAERPITTSVTTCQAGLKRRSLLAKKPSSCQSNDPVLMGRP